jgi:hypothetical protein
MIRYKQIMSRTEGRFTHYNVSISTAMPSIHLLVDYFVSNSHYIYGHNSE